MKPALRALLVEDSPDDVTLIVHDLRRHFDLTYERVDTADGLRHALAGRVWDVILSDFSMPSFSGMDALVIAKELAQDVPFIICSGTLGEEAAVEAMQAGAHDYVLKGKLSRLLPRVERALQDTAERRKRTEAERALRQTEEHVRQLQKLDAIGNLAGGIAHDFNNLLTVILGHTELLLLKLPPNDPMRRELDLIVKTGERAAGLTRQLLAFSRRQPMNKSVIEINALVSDMDRMLRRLIKEDVEIVTRLNSQLGKIKADPGQIEQVVMNLAVNARDAMPNGGTLVIETADVELDEHYARKHTDVSPGQYVLLAVSDNGAGMDAALQQRIFEPFFTTKEKGKGTGLGLATVYGIIKQSGGSIWVYSQPGRGTTFKIYLPRVNDDQKPERAPELVAPAKLPTECILLVEDEEDVRDLVRSVLSHRGYRVLECHDGASALETCRTFAGKIDVVLTDVVMPNMSGQELWTEIRKTRGDTRVLFMSGYTETALAQQSDKAPAKFFLEKPFTPRSLIERLDSVLRA